MSSATTSLPSRPPGVRVTSLAASWVGCAFVASGVGLVVGWKIVGGEGSLHAAGYGSGTAAAGTLAGVATLVFATLITRGAVAPALLAASSVRLLAGLGLALGTYMASRPEPKIAFWGAFLAASLVGLLLETGAAMLFARHQAQPMGQTAGPSAGQPTGHLAGHLAGPPGSQSTSQQTPRIQEGVA
ncbi:MAG: hypothetical protein SFZ23_01980 [Planctomycetota bacterium]|nr:hypothetical protein [Planctomycetota bacterium]